MKKKLLSLLALLCMTASGAWAQHKPSGNFDYAAGHQGSISVTGWAWDQDKPNTPISVHVYVFKDKSGNLTPSPSNSNVLASQSIEANNYRSDIIPTTIDNGNHGFALTFEVNATSGDYYVCAYGIDNTDGNILLNGVGKDITILTPFTVSYNANNGTGAPSAQEKRYDITLTLSSTMPTRTGYTFAGWNTAADGSGTSYAAGATYTGNANLTLYAQWTQNTATLTDGEGITALSTWSGKTCTVTYTRSFTSGKASTVCLPFAYTPKTGEKFYTFSGITKSGSDYVATMTEAATSPLTANTPYLFMPTGNADFSGTYTIPAELTAGTTTNGDWTFVGTYTEQKWTEAPTGIYGFSAQATGGISQGEFVKVGAYVKVKPMRAYLKYKDGGEDYAGARSMDRAASSETLPETISVRLIDAEGNVTGIGTLETRTGEVRFDPEAWYTLNGVRLSGQPTQKGIYVNNGKKVIIK